MTLNTAIIGCGRIGWLLEEDPKREKPCTHAGAIAQIPSFSINSACDIKKKRLKHFAAHFKISEEHLYTDTAHFFNNENPDLLVIATWTESHFDIIRQAIRANIPLIVAEKPITLIFRDSLKIEQLLKKSSSRLIINHERRYSLKYRNLFRMIAGKKLGDIRSIRGNMLSSAAKNSQSLIKRSERHGGILAHDGTHLLDLIARIASPLKSVRAYGEFYEPAQAGWEKWLSAQIFTEKGPSIQLEFSGLYDYFHFELDVWGSFGRYTMGNGFEHLYLAEDSPYYEGFRSLQEKNAYSANEGKSPFYNLYHEIATFFTTNKGKKFVFQSEFKDAMESMKLIHAIHLSALNKGKLVNIS